MANLAHLPLEHEGGLTRVVIETPRGSTQKVDYDETLECFVLKRRLPLGVAYPFDFGFVPSTRGGDGDPLDAIVLSDAPLFTGLVVPCRVVGMLGVSQTEQRRTVRNDRFIAIPDADVMHAHIADVGDIGRQMRREIEEFLSASITLEEKKIRFRGWLGRRAARKALAAGRI
jgi:inorganic pyrophosphatase